MTLQGGTRGVAFLHSPLLAVSGLVSPNLMHGVDWLPTFMAAIGRPATEVGEAGRDGVSQWEALQDPALPQPREEVVVNIKEKPFMAALRLGDYKIIWGSRTEKDIWFPAKEEPINRHVCEEILRNRPKVNRSRSILAPRDVETMDVWKLDVSEDVEYEAEYDKLEELQQGDLQAGGLDLLTELAESLRERIGKNANRKGGGGGGGGGGGNKKNKKKNKKNYWKNSFLIPNENNVKIRTWGNIMLFNVAEDPEERDDLSQSEPEVVERLKGRAIEHFYHLQPRHVPEDNTAGDPVHWGGYYGPGWCDIYNVGE